MPYLTIELESNADSGLHDNNVLAAEGTSEAALRASFQVTAASSPYVDYACVDSWLADFRADLPSIDADDLNAASLRFLAR